MRSARGHRTAGRACAWRVFVSPAAAWCLSLSMLTLGVLLRRSSAFVAKGCGARVPSAGMRRARSAFVAISVRPSTTVPQEACSGSESPPSSCGTFVEDEMTSSAMRAAALAKQERKKRRMEARLARRSNVGRAKSVRRAGSSTETSGLEALLPPTGDSDSGSPALSGLPDLSRPFTVLGIETSCDDTAAAVVRSDGAVLGEAIAGQAEIHERWGGVVPGLAMEAHEKKMEGVVRDALAAAGMSSVGDVDAVAVTVGPGLEICLRVGCEKAKSLATEHQKPFVAVHHLEAHTLLARKPCGTPAGSNPAPLPPSSSLSSTSSSSPSSPEPSQTRGEGTLSPTNRPAVVDNARNGNDNDHWSLDFPFLGLLVSGGHCQLLLCEGVGKYQVLGGTMDDALGEAYDKAARLLGLRVGGGGGPAVEALALQGDPKSFPLTVPMQLRKDCDFSFAGLKNAFRLVVTRAVEDHEKSVREQQRDDAENLPDVASEIARSDGHSDRSTMESRGAALPEGLRADLAASFQHTAIRHLEQRVRRAMDICEKRTKSQSSSSSSWSSLPAGLSSESEQHVGMVIDRTAETTGSVPDYDAASISVTLAEKSTDEATTDSHAPISTEAGPPQGREVLDGEKRDEGRRQRGVWSIAVVGGVAANQELRRRLQALCDERDVPWRMVVPPARLCTDNGVMVAWAGIERLKMGMSNSAEGQMVYARLPLGPDADAVDDPADVSSDAVADEMVAR